MRMVDRQIEARGIKDTKLLAAMRKIERHRFVPESQALRAYDDRPLPIGEGQTISQPYIVAFMTEALGLTGSERVLEIGTGSGYQAAVLAELCASVYSIEIVESLGKRAKALLAELGYDNIHVRIGDGYKGWPEHALFDAIIVTCSPSDVPAPLKAQLADGGRMIIPVGSSYTQQLVVLRRKGDSLSQEHVLPVAFVPMVNETGTRY